jgi:hypothetical protein
MFPSFSNCLEARLGETGTERRWGLARPLESESEQGQTDPCRLESQPATELLPEEQG